MFLAWLSLSIFAAAAIVLPLVASERFIAAVTPQCVWRTTMGRECPVCGLTTAFVFIGRGEWNEAQAANRGGISLYGMFAANSLVAAGVLINRRPWKGKRP